MSYTLVVSSAADAQLNALPAELIHYIRKQLARLVESPSALSQPVKILQPRGQLFEFRYDTGGVTIWISVIFRFGQDEQTIHVEHISVEFG